MGNPAGVRTRGEIIENGLKRAGNTRIVVEARVRLNRILDDLYLEYAWPFLHIELAFGLVAASFNLPTDFLITVDDDGLSVTSINGVAVSIPVREVDRQTYQRLAQPIAAGSSTTYPLVWNVDRGVAPALARVYPTPTATIQMLLRYKFRPTEPDPTSPGAYDLTVPLFPYDTYLEDAIYVWALEYDSSPRAEGEGAKLRLHLTNIRNIAIPLRATRTDIPLDDQLFRTPFQGPGTGTTWWT